MFSIDDCTLYNMCCTYIVIKILLFGLVNSMIYYNKTFERNEFFFSWMAEAYIWIMIEWEECKSSIIACRTYPCSSVYRNIAQRQKAIIELTLKKKKITAKMLRSSKFDQLFLLFQLQRRPNKYLKGLVYKWLVLTFSVFIWRSLNLYYVQIRINYLD